MLDLHETIRLYDRDAYATDFEAVVVACEELVNKKETLYQIYLDQTLFFPEEGGQSADKGFLTIADDDNKQPLQVLDVQIKKNVIRHTIARPLEPGTKVAGKVDWKHRYSNMQHHSGEHIFSGLTCRTYDCANVGFHLSDQIVTMDFNKPLTFEELTRIEQMANDAIYRNVEIKVSFPSKEELAHMEYRSKIEIEGQVRIVEVPGCDICACCAPHVRRTGEIGMLKIMNVSNHKGGVRVSILCGYRALDAFREKNRIITDIMAVLTTGQDQLAEQVSKMKNANAIMAGELAQAKRQLLEYKLSSIPAEQEDVLLFEQGLDSNVVRQVVNTLTQTHSGICGIFSGDDAKGYSFVIGSGSKDCKAIANSLRQQLSAKGGGSSQMIQGSVQATRERICKAMAEL